MKTKDGVSPEEKLLRLIKNQGKPAGAAVSKKNGPRKINLAFTLKPFLTFQKIMIPVFAASCIYLAISFLYPLFNNKENKLLPSAAEKTAEPVIEQAIEAKPYDYYLQGTEKRKIFDTLSSESSERLASGADNAELSKELNLVGIISGDNPQAVIEDKKISKTYYINKGQFIREFQVEDIQEGKVVLSCNGQKFELFL